MGPEDIDYHAQRVAQLQKQQAVRRNYNPANVVGANDFHSPWREKSDSAIQLALRNNAARRAQSTGLGVNHPLEIAARQQSVVPPPPDPNGWGRAGGGASSLDLPQRGPYAGFDGRANENRGISGGAMDAHSTDSFMHRALLERNLDNDQVNRGIARNAVLAGKQPPAYAAYVGDSQPTGDQARSFNAAYGPLPGQAQGDALPVAGHGLLAGIQKPNVPVPSAEREMQGPPAMLRRPDFSQARPLVRRQPNLNRQSVSPTAQPVGQQQAAVQDPAARLQAAYGKLAQLQASGADFRAINAAKTEIEGLEKGPAFAEAQKRAMADPVAEAMMGGLAAGTVTPGQIEAQQRRGQFAQQPLPGQGYIDPAHANARLTAGGLMPDVMNHLRGEDPMAALAGALGHGHAGLDDPNSEAARGLAALFDQKFGQAGRDTVLKGPQDGWLTSLDAQDRARQAKAQAFMQALQGMASGQPPGVPVPPQPQPLSSNGNPFLRMMTQPISNAARTYIPKLMGF